MRSRDFSAPPWFWIFLACLLLLLGANYLLYKSVDFDDNWITYRYAKNLAAGQGFAFNPRDARPTEGFTSLFHVLFTALGFRLGFEPLLFSQLASLLLLASLPLLVFWNLRRHWKDAPLGALIPLALYLPAKNTAWQVGTGMETIFFAVGVLLLAMLAADATTSDSPKLSAALGLAGIALVLVRPEAGILFAGHLGLMALRGRRIGFLRSVVNLAAAGGTFFLGLGAYLIWKWRYFGFLLPNSYHVKTHGGVFGLPAESWPGLRHVIQFLVSYECGFPQAAILVVILLLLRPRAVLEPARAMLAHQWVPTALLLAYYTRIIHESCQFRLEFMALLPLLGSASVLIASPGAPPRGEADDSLRTLLFRMVGPLVAGFTLLMAEPWNLRHLPDAWRGQGASSGGILFQIGEDLKRTGLGQDLVVMTGAVGVPAYVSDVTTLDFVGLTDEVFCGRGHRDVAAAERYYRSRHPDVITVKWPPAQAAKKEEDPAFQAMLRSLRGKYPEGLMVRLFRSGAFLDFVHFVMRDLRDRYELVAVYGDGPTMIYARRDSPKAAAVRRAFNASPYVLRGIDPGAYVTMKAAVGELDPY